MLRLARRQTRCKGCKRNEACRRAFDPARSLVTGRFPHSRGRRPSIAHFWQPFSGHSSRVKRAGYH